MTDCLDFETECARLAKAKAEHAALVQAQARGELPSRQAVLDGMMAEALRAGFSPPYDDDDDGPLAA